MSSTPFIMAFFAVKSAISLPSTSTWEGIHSICITLPLDLALSKRVNIRLILSGLVLDLPARRACTELRESVNITESGILFSVIQIMACSIAISSVVNMDKIGLHLKPSLISSECITKAVPV